MDTIQLTWQLYQAARWRSPSQSVRSELPSPGSPLAIYLYFKILTTSSSAWGIVDSKITAEFASLYRPAPVAENPRFTPEQDVTAIVITLDPPAELRECLLNAYLNNPLEIIISTPKEHVRAVLEALRQLVYSAELDRTRFSVIESERGARVQLATAIEKAKGSIIATCNDRVEWQPGYLTHMLACFENPKVGAAGPYIVPRPGEEDSITPWEVAGTKLAARSPTSWTSMHVAAKWCWILCGATAVFRARILKQRDFLEAYTNDYWGGKKLDVGDDTFISRWLLKNNWIIATQYSQETKVLKSVKRTPAFINQMLRWERSTIQSFIRTTYEVPQMWK